MLMGKGQKEDAESRKKEVEELKQVAKPLEAQLEAVEKQLNELLLRLPNLPSPLVPKGKTPEDNEIIRTGGSQAPIICRCCTALGPG
jgi:seryl-tRNA synthetase